jgi:hypothetical protein
MKRPICAGKTGVGELAVVGLAGAAGCMWNLVEGYI